MSVFSRLINRLHRVFNKDPQRIPAITLQSIAPYQIEITDSAVNLTADNGSVSVPITDTVADLADAINSGIATISPPSGPFAVATANPVFATSSAVGILPDAPTVAASTFDIYYPQSILYKEFQVYSWELDDQASRIKSLNNDLYMHSATDTWLEYWLNDHFNIPRYQSETDAEYFTRAKYEIIALKVNNKALENLVFNALGVKVRILDAYPLRSELTPQDQPSAAGRFVLDMSIPNALSTADAQELIDRVKAIVRKYRAAGTDFINALRKYEAPLETQPTAESMTATIGMPDIEEGPRPGLIYVGAGWRVGTPGLVVGTNDGIKEQILVKKLNSDGTLAAQYLYGG